MCNVTKAQAIIDLELDRDSNHLAQWFSNKNHCRSFKGRSSSRALLPEMRFVTVPWEMMMLHQVQEP